MHEPSPLRCPRKLSANVNIVGKFHDLQNKPYKATKNVKYSVFAFSYRAKFRGGRSAAYLDFRMPNRNPKP